MIEILKNQKFKSQINTIELTKQLTREPCDSLSFTHRLSKVAIPNSRYANYTATATKSYLGDTETISPFDSNMIWEKIYSNVLYTTPCNMAGIKVYEIPFRVEGLDIHYTPQLTVYVLQGDTEVYKKSYAYDADGFGKVLDTINLAEGNYVVKYELSQSATSTYRVTLTYNITAANAEISAKPIPSITDVLNRILDVGVPRLVYEEPKYKLDTVIAQKFANVPAPEFFLPRMTLYEALLTVGGYIHGIPRLIWNETTDKADTITFDLLGLDEEYELPSTAKIIGYKRKRGANDYCGALESYVENLVDTQNQAVGSIVEPFIDGYKTVRCNSGIQINNETAVITTDKPIYRLVKLEMAYTDGDTTTVIGDITNFVYEQAEYDTLFVSDAVGYPNSVAYALGYRQGGREIFGLNTASSSILNILNSFKEPAIQNIVKTVGRGEISDSASFANLAFRVTYIPIDTVRVRARKPYNDFPEDNVLFDNQGAGVVEASFYGENMKGKIARLGNDVEMYTVRFDDQTQLPKLGNIFDNSYVFKITRRRGRYHTIANIYITPNFNKLSEYLGLNSNYRLYEVSEKQSIDRNIIFERKIEIGHDIPTGGINSGAQLLAHKFWQTFTHSTTEESDNKDVANIAIMRFYGKDDKPIGEPILKGISHHSFGNSLIFSWKLEDSYSAGYQADYVPPINGTNVAWKQCRNVQYGDIFGGFYQLEFGICPNLLVRNANNEIVPFAPKWEQQLSTPAEQGFCDKLPVISFETYYNTLNLQDNYSRHILAVDKNSSEAISVTVQYYGQCTDKSIVMGKKLWDNNFAVNPNRILEKPKFYFLKKRINMLRDVVDLTDSTNIEIADTDLYAFTENKKFYIKSVANDTNNTFKAWVIVEPASGSFYIGENMVIAPGESTKPIYFNFN